MYQLLTQMLILRHNLTKTYADEVKKITNVTLPVSLKTAELNEGDMEIVRKSLKTNVGQSLSSLLSREKKYSWLI